MKAHFRKCKALVALANEASVSELQESWAAAAAAIELAIQLCPGDDDLEKLMEVVREKKMVLDLEGITDRQAVNEQKEVDAAKEAGIEIETPPAVVLEETPDVVVQEAAAVVEAAAAEVVAAPIEQVPAAAPEVLDKAALLSLD